MKKFIKFNWLLLIIVGVAFVLRTYKIDSIPPSLSWDEVSIGYNAYSILKTGRDEHQRLFPFDTFIAFGDYKPPVPIYITVPFVALFGLNELAVRLPSALFGTATVLITFFLVVELLKGKKSKHTVALLSCIILAFSPWHINISRAGFEANIALFWVVLGILLLLKTREKSLYFWIGWVPFVIAIYTFNSARYFTPFIALALVWILRKHINVKKRSFLGGIMLACLLMLPILPHLLSPEARLRFNEVNIFTDASVVQISNLRTATAGNTWWANILTNRRVGYALSYVRHYLDHFDPSYLFIKGDGNPKFSIQDVGQLYVVEIPFLLIGLFALFRDEPKLASFLLLWLMLAIIPAATARETPHALRTLNTLPTWHIFIAYGIYSLWATVRQNKKNVVAGVIVLLFVGNIVYYLHNYYRHYPYDYSGEWQYGYREAVWYAESVKEKYQHIVISDVIGRPYAYTLFYGTYDPNEFWRTKKDTFDAAGFYHVYGFGRYEFPEKSVTISEKNTLYILPPENVPKEATVRQTIRRLNGIPIFVAFEL